MIPFDPITALATAKTLANTIKAIREALPIKNSNDLEPILESLLSARIIAIEVVDALASAKSRIAELEEELRNIHSFAARREQYALYELPSGQFVFREKVSSERKRSATDICPHCLEDEKISILQIRSNSFASALCCQRCSAEYALEADGR